VEAKNARFSISISEGRFEIEGTEEFVQKHLDGFKEHVEKSLQRMVESSKLLAPAAGNPAGKQAVVATTIADPSGLAGYEYLFTKVDDKIQILKPLPGTNKKEKTISAALLVALAHRIVGVEPVSFDAIREVCKGDGSYDGSNFAT
jgi:hypothetical protein